MDYVVSWIKGAAGVLGGLLAFLFGAWDALIMVLLAMVAIDFLSGVLAAAARKELSSEVGTKGIIKKIGIFAIVAVAVLVDRIMPAANGAMRSAACAFFIANEGLSVLENWGNMGLPLPRKMREVLKQLMEKGKDEERVQ